jgi:aspartate/methionine/tyrosine aminotransferase
MVGALLAQAAKGTRLVVVLDDAYFGLFYHLGGESMTESLFSPLTNAHENILAVRLDGATKELFVWGLRCGFITFGAGCAEASDEVSAVLDAKLRGAIRSGISSVPQLSQSLISSALAAPTIDQEREQKRVILEARAQKVLEVANDERFRTSWNVYPFNSGYFMCVKTKGADAEAVRLHLLDRDGIGVISVGGTDVRVAFSCLELDEIEPLFEALHLAIQELAQAS